MGTRIKLKDQPPLVTIDGFLSTYRDPSRTASQETKEFLESKGLLPLTYESPLLPSLNALISAIIWSGSISQNSSYKPKGNLNLDEKTRKSLEEEISDLEVTIAPGQATHTLGQNGAGYARLISQIPGMFFSQGGGEKTDRKAYRPVTLPEFYGFLTSKYTQLRGRDKRVARKIIADNLKVLLGTKMRRKRNNSLSFQIDLFENADEEVAREFGLEVLKMFNAVYPMLGLSEESISQERRERGTRVRYKGCIRFGSEEMIKALQHYNLFSINLNPGFHPINKRMGFRG